MKNTLKFYKYQGTGNDFIMIDNRNLHFQKDTPTIEHLCDRRFGIGGDGLILLENDDTADFKMVYYNSDGNESTMCGNGGRCIVAFAHFLDIFEEHCQFNAVDGLHEAKIEKNIVKLKMIDVDSISQIDGDSILNTGSPHFVRLVNDLQHYDVYNNGHNIRYSPTYQQEGINVNFMEQISENEIFVRTYERGVEDETYSCGTGVTASALAFVRHKNRSSIKVKTLGGELKVYAEEQTPHSFKNIWLEGPAKQVFKGEIYI